MDGPKCGQCGLINLAAVDVCRRCGRLLGMGKKRKADPRERARRFSPLYTLLAVTLVGAAIYYIYTGARASIESVPATTPGKPIVATRQNPANAQRAAVSNSNGVAASRKHTAEVEKLTQTPK